MGTEETLQSNTIPYHRKHVQLKTNCYNAFYCSPTLKINILGNKQDPI